MKIRAEYEIGHNDDDHLGIYSDLVIGSTLEDFLYSKENLAKHIGITVEELEEALKYKVRNEKVRLKIEKFFSQQAENLVRTVYFRNQRHGKLMNTDGDYIDNPLV